MVSKNQIKLVKSLELKKNRKREGLFVAEGPKVVGDLLRAGFCPHTHTHTHKFKKGQQDNNTKTKGEMYVRSLHFNLALLFSFVVVLEL